MKTLCLIMIVRNESKIIVRLLNSLKRIIDFISIVDTGSTDNTKELIENWGKKHKKPTVVHSTPFVNFEFNRNDSFIKGKTSFPQADYFILSDADHEWEISDKFNKFWLMDTGYKVLEVSENLENPNIRIINAKNNWKCVGVTHEYWGCDETHNHKLLKYIKINDRHDGGCKTDKFQRDERLLRSGLYEEKQLNLKARYSFYLAETLKNTQQYEEAIKMYKHCFKWKNWDGEIYCAHLSIVRCAAELVEQHMKNKVKAYEYLQMCIEHAFLAYEIDSSRTEALWELCEVYHFLNMHEQAYNILKKLVNIPQPTNKLFLQIQRYGIYVKYFLWWMVLYTGRKEEQMKLTEEILTTKNVPEYMIANCNKYSYLCNPMIANE